MLSACRLLKRVATVVPDAAALKNVPRSLSAAAAVSRAAVSDNVDVQEEFSSVTTDGVSWSSIPEPNYDGFANKTKMNLFTAINSAMQTALETDPSTVIFGEDVGAFPHRVISFVSWSLRPYCCANISS